MCLKNISQFLVVIPAILVTIFASTTAIAIDNLGSPPWMDPECLGSLRGTDMLHTVVTDRGYFYYVDMLLASENLPGVYGTSLPRFDFTGAKNGQVSVVSLGEGDGNLIFRLNQETTSLGRNPPHHAVDVAFAESVSIRPNQRAMVRFPNNYHSQTFQIMNLLDEKGDRLLFDEAVSSHSFSYVLKRYFRWGEFEMARTSLRNVLDHLKPGGIFRSWALRGVKGSLDRHLPELLEEFKQQERIADYGVGAQPRTYTDDEYGSVFFWFKKSEAASDH